MAKRGAVQHLQSEINTEDDLEQFITRKGLILLDVYTEWCGPCGGIVSSLKKVKVEQGGDDLHLGIAKSDNIQQFERFRNKSEPTWIFISNGKIVNCMFGANVPKLVKTILKELELERQAQAGNETRKFYNWDELTPEEMERFNIQMTIIKEQKRIEFEEAESKRIAYLTFVVETVMEHISDMGITIFFPHVIDHSLIKKVLEPADRCGITPKERKTIQFLPEHFETLLFHCSNPILQDIFNHICKKDLLAVAWKNDSPDSTIEDLLEKYENCLVKEQFKLDEFGVPIPESATPPTLKHANITLKRIIQVKKSNEEIVSPNPVPNDEDETNLNQEQNSNEEILDSLNKETEDNVVENLPVKTDPIVEEFEEIEEEYSVEVPAMWTPRNADSNAILIYLFFRSFTEQFLPPDPTPEPPHVAISFDVFKAKDVFEVCSKYQDAILAYGYFTTDEPNSAQLIANSTRKYQSTQKSPYDKLVMKVAKDTSNALLALCAEGPCFVSLDSVIGKKECLLFFPNGYENAPEESDEGEDNKKDQAEEKGKKKKKKQKKKEKTDDSPDEAEDDDEEEKSLIPSELLEDEEVEENDEEQTPA